MADVGWTPISLHCVRWVRRFLERPACNEPLADQVLRFSEDLERGGACPDWQVRQAEQAVRMYFVNFLQRTDWHRQGADISALLPVLSTYLGHVEPKNTYWYYSDSRVIPIPAPSRV